MCAIFDIIILCFVNVILLLIICLWETCYRDNFQLLKIYCLEVRKTNTRYVHLILYIHFHISPVSKCNILFKITNMAAEKHYFSTLKCWKLLHYKNVQGEAPRPLSCSPQRLRIAAHSTISFLPSFPFFRSYRLTQ